MSGLVKLKLPSGGSKTLSAPDSASDEVITLPAGNATLSTFANDGTGQLNTAGITEDASGRVTMPNQPAFRVKNSYQDINATGTHEVAFSNDTTNNAFDTGGNFNTGTYRFTAPVSGNYWFSANLRIDGASNYFRLYISKNGQTSPADNLHSISGNNISTNYESLTVSGAIKLSTNDYVSVFVVSDVDTSWAAQTESNFSGHLIG